MDSLDFTRDYVVTGSLSNAVQSVAGFASLHCGITMLVALMVQYTIHIRWLRIAVWVNFGITAVATLYFGWHYIADDVAGILIALVSFYVGGAGQRPEVRARAGCARTRPPPPRRSRSCATDPIPTNYIV